MHKIHLCPGPRWGAYLSVHCTPVTAVSSRHLRSANQHQLTVPRCRRITFGRRAFSVAGPMVWNSLPTEFHDCLSVLVTSDAALRRYCSRDISALSTIEMHCIILRYINFLFYSILFIYSMIRHVLLQYAYWYVSFLFVC